LFRYSHSNGSFFESPSTPAVLGLFRTSTGTNYLQYHFHLVTKILDNSITLSAATRITILIATHHINTSTVVTNPIIYLLLVPPLQASMHSFVYGILGGAIIGLSAAVLLLFSGDILGASGIISSLTLYPTATLRDVNQHWKVVHVAAFLLTSHLYYASEYQDKENGLASLSWSAFLIGGFFVGFGTRLGNGCTSGHGICGLARFSKRSLVSVCSFMAVGILTTYLTQEATTPFPKETFDFLRSNPEDPIEIWDTFAALLAGFVALVAFVAPSFHILGGEDDPKASSNARRKLAAATVAGVLFSSGLYISEMVYPVRVLGFLNVGLMWEGEWDATLMFVMGGGVIISLISYQLIDGYAVMGRFLPFRPLTRPLALSDDSKFCVPANCIIDRDLILGAISFGFGWGISGLCPGPAMVLAGVGVSWVLVCYWPAFFIGACLAQLLKERNCGFRQTSIPDNRECKVNTEVATPSFKEEDHIAPDESTDLEKSNVE